MRILTTKARMRQQGATLVETLIALLIFALGMLGIAGLIGAAVKFQNGNVARMSVAAGIDDIIERMRSNVTETTGARFRPVAGGPEVVGTGYTYAQDYSTQVAGAAPTYSKDCIAAVCTQAERAAFDVVAWRNLLRDTLPGGAGFISGSVNAGMDVTVMWFDKNAVLGDDAAFTDTLQANQTCNAGDASTQPVSRFCCPAAAAAPDGVRCYTARLIP